MQPPQTPNRPVVHYASMVIAVLALITAAAGLLANGNLDPKPMQADLDDLKSQVAKLQSQLEQSRTSYIQIGKTANEALAAAQASQSAVDTTNANVKIDKLFNQSTRR